MPHMNSSSDDLAFTDEVKVYKDEGDEDDEEKSSENLKEDKVGLVNEGEEKTPLEFDLYNKQYASSMFKVPFTTDPRFANYFMSNYPTYMNGSSNPSSFMGNKIPLISSPVSNPFNFIPFPMHDPFAQNVSNPRYQLPDPKRIAAAAAAHFYSLPSSAQLQDAWSCDSLSHQSSFLGSHQADTGSSSKSSSSNSNRISFSVSSIADSDKSPSRLLSDPRSMSDFSSNNSVIGTGMPLSPSMFAAAAVAAAQAAAFNSSNCNSDVSSLHKAAAAHLRFLSSLHYQKQQSPSNNGTSMPSCYPNSSLVPSRAANLGKYHHNYPSPMHQKSSVDDRKSYAESLSSDRYHHSSDQSRHVSAFAGDTSDIESRKTIYSSRNSIDPRGSVTSPDSPKKPHIKKPLNAFMLFMKEMRPRVQEECTLKESAAINQILGKKWHELTREEQTKYYELARKEKELHQQLYPGWSARDNYAAHAKRRKKRKLLNSSILNSRDNFLSMNMISMGHYGGSSNGYSGGDQNPCDMRSGRASLDNGTRHSSIDMMMCVDTGRRHNGASVQTMLGSSLAPNGSNPKKCRARFGLEHQNLWCKPCRRKKKCVRFIYNTTDDSLAELVQTSNPDSGKQECRARHRLEHAYPHKSSPGPDKRHMSPITKTEETTESSFRSISALNRLSGTLKLHKNYGKAAKDRSPLVSRKRAQSTSSTENEQQAGHDSPSSSQHKNSKISNHSIEYHLSSQFSGSTVHTHTHLDPIGCDAVPPTNGNAFSLDQVLSGVHVHRTICTPPTPAVYCELDYPGPLSRDKGAGTATKEDEYEFREPSDSSPRSSASVTSEPLRMSALIHLVK